MRGLDSDLVSVGGKHWEVKKWVRVPDKLVYSPDGDPNKTKQLFKNVHRAIGYVKEIEANKYEGALWNMYGNKQIYPSVHHAHKDIDEQFTVNEVIRKLES